MKRRAFLPLALAILAFWAALIRPDYQPPAQAASQNFGVTFVGASSVTIAHTLSQVGAFSWYDFANTDANPSSFNKVLLVRTNVANLSLAQLQSMAATANSGAYWIIGNEPNVPGQDNVSGDTYAQRYKYYWDTIKQLDPSAKLVAGNVLNWNNTCFSCGGFTQGQSWVASFIQAYQSQNGGAMPPVDVWGIHAYIIDWGNVPMVNWQLARDDISAFRTYLDSLPSQAGKPIWITEFGVVWGYTGHEGKGNSSCSQGHDCLGPRAGDTYAQAQISDYLNQFVGWLKDNAASKNIQRWFVYAAYGNPEPYSNVYGGISLMDGPGGSAALTASGLVYQGLSGGAIPTPTPTPGSAPPLGGGGGGSAATATPVPTATRTPTATPIATSTPVAAPPASAVVGPDGGSVAVAGGALVDGGLTTVVAPGTWPGLINVTTSVINSAPSGVTAPSGAQLLNKTIEVVTSEPVTLAKTMGLQINLTPSEMSGWSIQNIRGGVIVNSKVEPRPTRVLDQAQGVIWIDIDHLSKFTLFAVANPGPALTEPAGETTLAGLGANLTWVNPSGTTQYHLQVIPFNNDGPGIDLIRNVESSFQVNAPNFGSADPNYVMLPDLTYVWRVRTTTVNLSASQLSESDWTAWSLGTFRTAAKSSATISHISPASGSTADSRTPTLQWDNSDKSIFYYEVQASKDPAFGPNAFLYWELRHGAVTSPVNSYTIPTQFPLEPSTTYHWRVRPRVQGNATPLAWTSAGFFQVGP